MRILITGGAGFIGSQLGLYLVKKGYSVIPLDNLKFGYMHNLADNKKLISNFIQMDIRDSKLENIMKDIDVVFHIAGFVSLPGCNDNPYEAYSVNAAGTANVLEMARRNGVKKVVFASTAALYENEHTLPFEESVLSQPTLIYAQTKKAAEDLCFSYIKLYGMDITSLRFFNVYGPHMDYRPPSYLISYLIKCLLKKERPILHSTGNQARDFIYISDVEKICEIVMTNPKAKQEVFNVGSGTKTSIQEIFDIIAGYLKEKEIKPIYRDPKLIWEKFPRQLKGRYPIDSILLEKEVNKITLANIKKAKKLLNWEAKVSVEKGLLETIAYVKKNNYNQKVTIYDRKRIKN